MLTAALALHPDTPGPLLDWAARQAADGGQDLHVTRVLAQRAHHPALLDKPWVQWQLMTTPTTPDPVAAEVVRRATTATLRRAMRQPGIPPHPSVPTTLWANACDRDDDTATVVDVATCPTTPAPVRREAVRRALGQALTLLDARRVVAAAAADPDTLPGLAQAAGMPHTAAWLLETHGAGDPRAHAAAALVAHARQTAQDTRVCLDAGGDAAARLLLQAGNGQSLTAIANHPTLSPALRVQAALTLLQTAPASPITAIALGWVADLLTDDDFARLLRTGTVPALGWPRLLSADRLTAAHLQQAYAAVTELDDPTGITLAMATIATHPATDPATAARALDHMDRYAGIAHDDLARWTRVAVAHPDVVLCLPLAELDRMHLALSGELSPLRLLLARRIATALTGELHRLATQPGAAAVAARLLDVSTSRFIGSFTTLVTTALYGAR